METVAASHLADSAHTVEHLEDNAVRCTDRLDRTLGDDLDPVSPGGDEQVRHEERTRLARTRVLDQSSGRSSGAPGIGTDDEHAVDRTRESAEEREVLVRDGVIARSRAHADGHRVADDTEIGSRRNIARPMGWPTEDDAGAAFLDPSLVAGECLVRDGAVCVGSGGARRLGWDHAHTVRRAGA
jgi:hypothetical protein